MKNILIILILLPLLNFAQVLKTTTSYNLGNYCFQGDGANNYVDYGTNVETSLSGNYSLYFRIKTTTTATQMIIQNRLPNFNNDGFACYISSAAPSEITIAYDNGASAVSDRTTGANINNGVWHDVFVTYGGGNTTITVDGTSRMNSSLTKTYGQYSDFLVGVLFDKASNHFDGCVADIRVFNTSFVYSELGNNTPIFYPPLGEGYNNQSYDVSGNSIIGTINGSDYWSDCSVNTTMEDLGCTYVTYGGHAVLVPYLLDGTELYTSVSPVLNAAETTREYPSTFWGITYILKSTTNILIQ